MCVVVGGVLVFGGGIWREEREERGGKAVVCRVWLQVQMQFWWDFG